MVLQKPYFRFLTHEDRVRVDMEIEKGQVTKFVIQYEMFVQGEWAPVTRFDTYHDAVH
jgi:acyl-CoA thioesterase FadM